MNPSYHQHGCARFYYLICLFTIMGALEGCFSEEYRTGRALENQGQLDQAEEVYLAVIAQKKQSWWQVGLGCPQEMVISAQHLMICNEKRTSALAENEQKQAIAILTRYLDTLIKVAQQNPDCDSYAETLSDYLIQIAWLHFSILDYQGAAEKLQSARNIYPLPEIYYLQGLIEWQRGNCDRARLLFEQTLESDTRYLRAQEALKNMSGMR